GGHRRQAHLPADARAGTREARRRGRLPGCRAARTVPCGEFMTVLTGRVVTAERVLEQGAVEVAVDRIAAATERAGTVENGQWLLPGFVDIHVHGGGGYTFTTGDPDQARGAARYHLGHGTTTLLASLVSSPYELMHDATKAFAPLVADGVLGGIHFEGPYLSRAQCGAQNPAYLRDPSPDELTALIGTGGGTIRMVTVAPERPGAIEAID